MYWIHSGLNEKHTHTHTQSKPRLCSGFLSDSRLTLKSIQYGNRWLRSAQIYASSGWGRRKRRLPAHLIDLGPKRKFECWAHLRRWQLISGQQICLFDRAESGRGPSNTCTRTTKRKREPNAHPFAATQSGRQAQAVANKRNQLENRWDKAKIIPRQFADKTTWQWTAADWQRGQKRPESGWML